MTKSVRINRKIYAPNDSYIPLDGFIKAEVLVQGSVLHRLERSEIVVRVMRSGPRLDFEMYTLAPRQSNKRKTNGDSPVSKGQIERNLRHSQKRAEQLAYANFIEGHDFFLTATIADNSELSVDAVKGLLKNYFNRLRRRRMQFLKKSEWKLIYIYCICEDPDHRIHVHMLINGGMPPDVFDEAWGHGIVDCKTLERNGGISRAVKYMIDQNRDLKVQEKFKKYSQMWVPSRGLKQPKVEYSFPNRRQLKLMNEPYAVKENSEKCYPSYTYKSGEVRICEVNGSRYASITMLKSNNDYPSMGETEKSQAQKTSHPVNVRIPPQSGKTNEIEKRSHNKPKIQKTTSAKEPKNIRSKYRFLARAEAIGPNTYMFMKFFIDGLPPEKYGCCYGILNKARTYNKEVLELCCAEALAEKTYTYTYIRSNIERCYKQWQDSLIREIRHSHNDHIEQLSFFAIIDGI